jgi:hypothetical protein
MDKKINFNPEAIGAYYYDHYYSNNNRMDKEYLEPLGLWNEDPRYTFMYDMTFYLNDVKKLSSYVDRMISRFVKHSAQAYCEMLDSLNNLGWLVYQHYGDCETSKWLFDKYNSLNMDWEKYVSKDQYYAIIYILN